MKMNKSIVMMMALLAGNIALADQAKDPQALDTSWLTVNGEVNLDYFASSTNDYASNLRAQDARITLTAKLAENIKAVVTAQISETLRQNGVDVKGEKFDLNKFIQEAYIEIKMDMGGNPIAVVVGKQAIPFGQNASKLPMFRDNLLYDVGTIDQVIGVTVRMDRNLLKFLDSAEISVFENGAEDLKIGDGAGVAIRVSKQLTEKLKATASGSRVEIGNTEKYETRGSLGLVFDNGNGTWRAFAEGFALHNSVAHPDSKWGATVGTSLHVGPGEVAVEYSYLEKAAQEVAVAYNLPLAAHLTISPEIRYIDNDNAAIQDGTRVGVRMKADFGPEEKQKQN